MLSELGNNKKVLLGLVIVGVLFLIIGLILWSTGVVGWIGGLFMIFLGLVLGGVAGGLWYMSKQKNKLNLVRDEAKEYKDVISKDYAREERETLAQNSPPPLPPRDESPFSGMMDEE